MQGRDVFVVDAVRTPVGRARLAWRHGESGDDVVARALVQLRQPGGVTTAAEPG